MRHRVTSAPDERRMEFIHQLTQREADNQTSEALPNDDQGVFLFFNLPKPRRVSWEFNIAFIFFPRSLGS